MLNFAVWWLCKICQSNVKECLHCLIKVNFLKIGSIIILFVFIVLLIFFQVILFPIIRRSTLQIGVLAMIFIIVADLLVLGIWFILLQLILSLMLWYRSDHIFQRLLLLDWLMFRKLALSLKLRVFASTICRKHIILVLL